MDSPDVVTQTDPTKGSRPGSLHKDKLEPRLNALVFLCSQPLVWVVSDYSDVVEQEAGGQLS